MTDTVNDGHIHLGFGSGISDSADFIAEMDIHGVARAAVITPANLAWDNTVTIDAVRDHPDRFVGIGRLDVSVATAARTCADLLDHGLRGIRLDLRRGADVLDTTNVDAVAEVLTGDGALLDLHVGAAELLAVHRWAEAHPGLRILLDHGARPDLTDPAHPRHRSLEPLAELPNVVVKTPNSSHFSRTTPPHRDLAGFHLWLLDIFGPQRVMWGSDWPVCLEGGPYGAALAAAEVALEAASVAERAAVLTDTFTNVFGETTQKDAR